MSPEYQIDSQKYISSAALPEVALALEQSFNTRKDDSWLGKVKVRHPMSGILTSETGSVRLGALEFLPSHLKVYLCHGQHRKQVLENAIQLALTKEKMAETGEEHPEAHKYPLKEVHQHKDAFWTMDVYQNSLMTDSMFFTWVLQDNAPVEKAPNLLLDYVNAYGTFINSNQVPTGLQRRAWWSGMLESNNSLEPLRPVLRSMEMLRVMTPMRKVKWFIQYTKSSFIRHMGGMQNSLSSGQLPLRFVSGS
ncbi:uncharacterized protein EI90DRAFT_3072768 [Cantharellus anzutake]|uniref:uncharacterized protein n=1 Tax=Cantharellus anzutake TaxID=1750568 RepID=UPI0019047E8B|nr:uncharacterized protein EI90DRAFT_3072768 [Cantharellus anzutake]KAF8325413.1 hypothetical protein EI90DRAFT_3072768 [Cantharellus anzutake]